MIKRIETDNYIKINQDQKTVIITKNAEKLFNLYVKNCKTIVANPATEEEVVLCVEHNNSKILILDKNILTNNQIEKFLQIYDKNSFSKDPRHVRRIEKMEKL